MGAKDGPFHSTESQTNPSLFMLNHANQGDFSTPIYFSCRQEGNVSLRFFVLSSSLSFGSSIAFCNSMERGGGEGGLYRESAVSFSFVLPFLSTSSLSFTLILCVVLPFLVQNLSHYKLMCIYYYIHGTGEEWEKNRISLSFSLSRSSYIYQMLGGYLREE